MNPTEQLNVLFIDDEADNLDAFVFNCEEFWNTRTVMDPRDVIAGRVSLEEHHAVMVDLVYDYPQDLTPEKKIDPVQGLEVLAWIQKNYPELPTMVLSAFLTADLRAEIQRKHPRVLCLDKPLDFSKDAFRAMVQKFIEDYRTGAKTGPVSEAPSRRVKET